MHVGIIGAGIGGLATASGLAANGHRVTVLERVERTSPVGSGLSLFGNAVTALDALGLGDAVRAISGGSVATLRAGQRRPDGRWIATIPPDALPHLRVVHRAELHEVLLGSLPRGTLRVGTEVTGITEVDAGVTLATPAGELGGFDLVVAADGIRSRTRASWPGDPGVRYSGYSTWRGVTREPVDLHGEAGETWGNGLRFGLAPLADGRVYWFGVATLPEGTVFDDELGELRRRFEGWHDPIAALIDATEPDAIARHDIHDLAGPVPTFVRGRVALLGDAAHAMTPDLGQGGGQALEDAATLVQLLGPATTAGTALDPTKIDPAHIDAALARYNTLRRARTQPIARRARMLGRLAQTRGAVRTRIRDLVIGATPASVLRRQLADLQDWTPPHA
ncbi:MAG: FAD-dependent monooxygenase [Microbacteriaceae bacterium]|nr:FAD-dependent monooxygenase [Microbacteriaceae bacterium]